MMLVQKKIYIRRMKPFIFISFQPNSTLSLSNSEIVQTLKIFYSVNICFLMVISDIHTCAERCCGKLANFLYFPTNTPRQPTGEMAENVSYTHQLLRLIHLLTTRSGQNDAHTLQTPAVSLHCHTQTSAFFPTKVVGTTQRVQHNFSASLSIP